jgi:energy-coupling factor transporter transmembrane protein EcfT
MALYYQTQYRLGRRGGRVCRSYSGFQAFMAILFDLVFGLVFELVSSVIAVAFRLVILTLQLVVQILRITSRVIVAVMTMVLYLVTLPFALIHETLARLRPPVKADCDTAFQGAPQKPEWAFSREV